MLLVDGNAGQISTRKAAAPAPPPYKNTYTNTQRTYTQAFFIHNLWHRPTVSFRVLQKL